MITSNEHYSKLQSSYLFATIGKKVAAFQEANPDKKIIKLGIGDVTLPLTPSVLAEFHQGVDDLAHEASFKGYGPGQGYDFLREAIAKNDYVNRNVGISADEVFVTDGAKSDSANFQEIFGTNIQVAVPDPVYPVYVDTNVMAGRSGTWTSGQYSSLNYLVGTRENGFVPAPPSNAVDLIYLCFPNNPTGAVATKEQLKAWVDYAHRVNALILFDGAYEAFVSDPEIPRSIYEINGAKEVAVEFRSLSKTAGFTGVRLAYTVIPKECRVFDETGKVQALSPLWVRRQSTKFNDVSYPVQKAAMGIYSEQGKKEVQERIAYYMENAKIISKTMEKLGYNYTGGKNSPYIWVDAKRDSWEFFEELLENAAVVTTPGAGFGKAGEGYIRISAFNHKEAVLEAMERLEKAF
jgi:LL-diaminopimelate aminotransferase